MEKNTAIPTFRDIASVCWSDDVGGQEEGFFLGGGLLGYVTQGRWRSGARKLPGDSAHHSCSALCRITQSLISRPSVHPEKVETHFIFSLSLRCYEIGTDRV